MRWFQGKNEGKKKRNTVWLDTHVAGFSFFFFGSFQAGDSGDGKRERVVREIG